MKQIEKSENYKPGRYCFCGGELVEFQYAESYRVCSKCNTFISQNPPPDSLVEFYGLKEYWHDYQQKIGHPTIENRLSGDILDGRIWKLLDIINRNCEPANAILEIGCAPGLLLALLSKTGHSICIGVEPHPETCRYIEDKFGVKCKSGVFPNMTFFSGTDNLDLVIAIDVVEHSYEPVNFFLKVNEILDSTGFFLLQTPIYKEEEWRAEPWGKQFPRLFRKWEHIHLFSERGIKWMAERTGFRIILEDRWAIGHDILLLQKRKKVYQ